MSIVLNIFVIVGGLILCLVLAGIWAKNRLRKTFPPDGLLVDVGGRTLHTKIQGEGSTIVVFESGIGGLALNWEKVQDEIAKSARTISYDRAGLGWSDKGMKPCSFEIMVADLKSLLDQANVTAPVILVGHSLGGIIVRQFARAYPELVAGIVFVDSAHEEQFTKRFPVEVREMASKMIKSMKPMILAIASGIPALLANKMPVTTGLSTNAAEAERAVRMMSSKHMQTVLDEMDAIVHHPPETVDKLGDLPLVVLSHGVAQPTPNMSDEVNTAYEATWQEMQRELAHLSYNSEHIIVEHSGHDIQLEQPEVVVKAILSILRQSMKSPEHSDFVQS